ncbi:hypothetical protein GMSM_05170 [Geomonas sp. Red276]
MGPETGGPAMVAPLQPDGAAGDDRYDKMYQYGGPITFHGAPPDAARFPPNKYRHFYQFLQGKESFLCRGAHRAAKLRARKKGMF